ncbi:cAMP-binding domain of CRP or a regulatory subunit of cAMP-dependent protein kinases [Anaerovirgula multivorans]|uniref:cAMP-binding domain of CRP or a regulatory subunit of cAMP-dependent protein kinases n=1 Tax=Anaerovirgula multivorans TaxID=312168 RepID=A0A239CZ23_9FIRM|nr:Crp/Fnr family transcriptional regulator [Anaerovirgula multivorans]SNS25360.1 cAMP-binding domain of CRP or a regulatory subunit of cAMP-dependent protein kinases [Anaerovirgula multivorans]
MDIKNYIYFLQLSDLFKDLSSEKLLEFFTKNNHKICKYEKNRIIHFESEKCTSWEIILKGKLIIQKIDDKGNVLTVTQFTVGDNLGGNLLFSKIPYYPMNVIAKIDTVVLHINKDLVLRFCQNNQNFLLHFLACISDKTSILTNKIKSITMKSIRESIIDFLNYEYYSQNSLTIKFPMTKKELAEQFGIQRTSLSRELNKMKKDGLITFTPHSITIKDFDIIKKLQ